MVIKMNRLEFKNKVYPLTKKEKFYKEHPSSTDNYIKKIDSSDNKFFFLLSNQDKMNLVKGNHAIFYDDQHITDEMLNFPILFTKQTRYSFIPLHVRDYIEMKYVYNGHCYAIINEKEVMLQAGDIILLDKNSSHTVLPPSKNDLIFNFQMNRSYFTDAFISKFVSSNPIVTFLTNIIDNTAKHDNYVIFKKRDDDNDDINTLIENILCEYLEPSPFASTVIDSNMLLLFVKMAQRYQANMEEEFRSKDKSYITEIIQYIQKNFINCSLTEIADLFGYNPDYLSRMIETSTGLTFKKLINYYKMEAASNELVNTDKPIYKIAEDCGYSNLNFFYKKFKSHFGGSPSDYRKQFSQHKY